MISNYIERGSEEHGHNMYDWRIEKQIVQCLGCEDVSFRVSSTNSEDYEHDDEGLMYNPPAVKYYPGRTAGSRIEEYWLLPNRISQIYSEARSAVEGELLIIAGIAIRALLEAICTEVKAAGRDLYKKIDDLHVKSLVTKEGVETLQKVRVLGNRAAHESEAHSQSQLILALEVVEHILVGAYIIPAKVKTTFKNLEVNAQNILAPPKAPTATE
ncbi:MULTISPECIES: DUF4145 domain-containing protein [unclassified Pseudomonas]